MRSPYPIISVSTVMSPRARGRSSITGGLEAMTRAATLKYGKGGIAGMNSKSGLHYKSNVLVIEMNIKTGAVSIMCSLGIQFAVAQGAAPLTPIVPVVSTSDWNATFGLKVSATNRP